MAPITRVLGFKFKDDTTTEKKQEIFKAYTTLLKEKSGATFGPRSMFIKQWGDFVWFNFCVGGTNRAPPQYDVGFDMVLMIQFPDREITTGYDVHPEHLAYMVR